MAEKGGAPGPLAGPRTVLESLRILRQIPPEVRARYERDETLEQMFARWQRVRVPDLPLVQRSHDPAWAGWFAAEKARIAAALGPRAVLLAHFGSTSVADLASKSIIDMVAGLPSPPDSRELAGALGPLGYVSYGNSPIDPQTLWLWRVEEERAFVLHACEQGRPWVRDSLDLWAYLGAHAAERERYAQLKQRISGDRDQSFLRYSISKMNLFLEMLDQARAWRAAGAGQGQAAQAPERQAPERQAPERQAPERQTRPKRPRSTTRR